MPLIPGRKARATVEGQAQQISKEDNNRVRRKQELRGDVDLNFDPGDEKARVDNTRGFKSWISGRNGGLTVESTVRVSVSCNQDQQSMEIAIHEAGVLAESEAKKGVYLTARLNSAREFAETRVAYLAAKPGSTFKFNTTKGFRKDKDAPVLITEPAILVVRLSSSDLDSLVLDDHGGFMQDFIHNGIIPPNLIKVRKYDRKS